MPNNNWDTHKLMVCLDRPEGFVNHLKQELTPAQAKNKREWIENRNREREVQNGKASNRSSR